MLEILELKQTTDVRELADQYYDHCVASSISTNTMPARMTRLNQFVEFCEEHGVDVTAINNRFIDLFYVEYAKTKKISSVNASKRVVKVFLTWVEEYKEMQLRVRGSAIKYSREPKTLPKSIPRNKILEAINKAEEYYDALMIETMWRTGIRIGELVQIKEGDIWGDEIRIRGKGSRERTVYITDSLAKKFKSLMTGYPARRVFVNNMWHYDPITKDAARIHIERCFENVGVTMVPHQLRHSFAHGLLMRGCDLVTIQKLLGHEHVSTTQIYVGLFDETVKEQYKKFML